MREVFPPSPTILETSNALREGRTTCRALVETCIHAYEKHEPTVKAWVTFDREGAMKQAEDLDREIAEARMRGPLHGIPIGVKDIVDVKGLRTEAGVRHWSNGPVEADAEIVSRLRKAGAVILGKTVTTPYAWVDPGQTRNPWNTARTPGGSSSGSAAAVAAGMAMAAIGTQTGGSIIRPASFCGVVGWKPSKTARSSRAGIVPFSETLDTPGFLTGRLEDIGPLQDATGSPIGPITDRPYPPRLGRLRGFFDDRAEPEMRLALEQAVEAWKAAGAWVEEVELPMFFTEVHAAHRAVMAFELAVAHSARFAAMPHDYPAQVTKLLREGLAIAETTYRQALELGEAVGRFLRPDLDAWITPAALGEAPGLETTGEPYFNSPWTFGGQPVLTFPMAVSADGMPLGVQFIGVEGAEADMISAALWCSRRIPVVSGDPTAVFSENEADR